MTTLFRGLVQIKYKKSFHNNPTTNVLLNKIGGEKDFTAEKDSTPNGVEQRKIFVNYPTCGGF